MASGKKGFGAKLEYDSGGAVWVAVGNITKIRPFAAKADVIDISNMDSPSQFREKMSGMLDNGQVAFDINYDDKSTSHIWLLTNLGVDKSFRVTFPGTAPKVASFGGFVQSVPPEIPFDNKMTCSPVIEISGVVTIA